MEFQYPPFKDTKKALSEYYWRLPKRFFRSTINRIISESRGVDINTAKYIKIITPKEFRLFVDEVDRV
ncbi:hypothetical protein [uncultured Tenacibaculum sp.]|uniref:hypothetical protein n=1 Tax=uncultured Tenacibaculum sp. TaxID=174713 RepID=UPI0026317301|nr:hypothetical protein [uncultured Tenacibaculum sp.]